MWLSGEQKSLFGWLTRRVGHTLIGASIAHLIRPPTHLYIVKIESHVNIQFVFKGRRISECRTVRYPTTNANPPNFRCKGRRTPSQSRTAIHSLVLLLWSQDAGTHSDPDTRCHCVHPWKNKPIYFPKKYMTAMNLSGYLVRPLDDPGSR